MNIPPDPPHDVEAMNRSLKGLTFVSSGPCPGCGECNLTDVREIDDEEYDLMNEPYFSRCACEFCHSCLGGNRYVVHARDPDNRIIHFDICEDCLMAIQ